MDKLPPKAEIPNQSAAPEQLNPEILETSARQPGAKEKAVPETKTEVGPSKVPVDGKPAAVSPPTDVTKSASLGAATVIADPGSSISKSSNKNSHTKVDQFFSLSQRLPVQIFNEETKLQKLAHWGPIVMGVASIVLTIFVWRNTENLTSRQIDLQAKQVELQSRQNELQNDQTQAELSDLRFKFLNDLTATDENKKTPAEISLAAHGLKAFPVVHYALGVEQGDIRKSAVNVVYRLFQAETNEGREELLNRLMGEFAFPNKTLHTGVVQSFVKVEPLLSPAQRGRIIVFLQQSVVPQNVCSEPEGREAVFEAAKFVGSKSADAIPYLVSVVSVARCGDAWLQAIYNLQTVAPEISAQERSSLLEKLAQVKQKVLDHLDQNISKQELVQGSGFAGFLSKGELSIEFNVFKKRVAQEFDTLISQLG